MLSIDPSIPLKRHRYYRGVGEHPRPESGATLVEFALIAPIFFAVVFAIFSIAIYVLEVQVANQAAQAAARWAVAAQNDGTTASSAPSNALTPPPCPSKSTSAPAGMQAAADAAAGPFASSLGVIDIGGQASSGPAQGSYYCQVTVTVPYTNITGFFGIGPQHIRATAIDYVT